MNKGVPIGMEIDKLRPEKEIKIPEQSDEDGNEKWPGNYKGYEVYED